MAVLREIGNGIGHRDQRRSCPQGEWSCAAVDVNETINDAIGRTVNLLIYVCCHRILAYGLVCANASTTVGVEVGHFDTG